MAFPLSCTFICFSLIVGHSFLPFSGFRVVHGYPACSNTCGGLPIAYPFGTSKGCGNKIFQSYTKCSKGKFYLTTETGQYEVNHIDYQLKSLIVLDKKMSTCSAMRRTTGMGFGLQGGTPFTLQGPHFVLLACIDPASPVQTSPSSICDAQASQLCRNLYSYCPTITKLGLSVNSAIKSCCSLKSNFLQNAPLEIEPKKYGCLSYTSIYRFGPGQGFSSNVQDPNTWSYGVPLLYTVDQVPESCSRCEASHGSCAFDDNSNLICVCSAKLNTSSTCPAGIILCPPLL
ncbi:hypothetical protein KP509_01G065700 [Ceratopteris richardii]|uniref:Wall-associated receptor kinase galacturonan-binding domain-containing protein n=1 Tax=Ceratopteris richardii TaxID=49495 RepID=A0A8T2VM40_CERRI|nr:hypothetical protein KP509_01G065700 [Ceratopteris richardii]